MKIGIIQTAPNNCAALDKIAARYPDLEIVHYVDGCLWAHFEAAGNVVNDKVNEILAADFNKLIDAGCESIGLLCNQIKGGIEKVQFTMMCLPGAPWRSPQREARLRWRP